MIRGLLQAQMLTSAAMKAGFSGGLVVDFPHSTRAKKYFLVLMVGSTTVVPVAKGLNGEEEYEADEVRVSARRTGGKKQKTGSFSTVSICFMFSSEFDSCPNDVVIWHRDSPVRERQCHWQYSGSCLPEKDFHAGIPGKNKGCLYALDDRL